MPGFKQTNNHKLIAQIGIGEAMFCSKCDTQNEEDAKFCKKCATELLELSEAVSNEREAAEDAEQTIPTQEAKSNQTIVSDSGSAEPTSEKKRLKDYQKTTMAAIGVIIISIAIVSFAALSNWNQNRLTSATSSKKQAIPAEAQKFVSEYGNRYSDPVSVYYAEKAYEKDNKSQIMSDEYINKYDASGLNGVSGLGFEKGTLPLNAEINLPLAIDVFNQYTAPELNLYMNALAKNPGQKATEVVDHEFLDFCSNNANTDLQGAFTKDDQFINTLMDTFKAIVSKYGSAANYQIGQGAAGDVSPSGPGSTRFPKNQHPIVMEKSESDKVVSFSVNADIVIFVDVYKGGSVSQVKEVIENVHLTTMRQSLVGPGNDPNGNSIISIGQLKLK